MLDSSSTSTRPSYLHSSSTPPQHTLVSIRNAIASESQRIRVQDESTGQSYELELGKGTPYPEGFGGEGDDDEGIRRGARGSQEKGPSPALAQTSASGSVKGNSRPSSIKASKLQSVLPLSSSSPSPSNGTPTQNGDAAESGRSSAQQSPSQGSTSSMRMLRLPAIVRSRHSNVNSVNGAGQNEAPQQHEKPQSSKMSTFLPGNATKLSRTPTSPISQGGAQLQELNKQYHDTLAANQAQSSLQLGRRTSRETRSSRSKASLPASQTSSPSKKASPSGVKAVGAPASSSSASQQPKMAHQPIPPQPQFVASPRHYPVMSELPPSPPLEDDLTIDGQAGNESTSGQLEAVMAGGTAAVTAAAPLPMIDTKNVPQTQRPKRLQARRQPSEASTAETVYMSADESGSSSKIGADGEDEDEEQTPTTPKQRSTTLSGLSAQLSSSPTRMTGSNSAEPLRRSTSPSPSGPMAAPGQSRALSSSPPKKGLLHPSSARPVGQERSFSTSPSSSSTSRFQPLRRNTADSTSSSHADSATLNGTGSRSAARRPSSSGGITRRMSKDIWMPGKGPEDGTTSTGTAAGDKLTASPSSHASPLPPSTSMSMSSGGPLRTGDAGFDEEIARQEALIRKRKERARREEETGKESHKTEKGMEKGGAAVTGTTGVSGGMVGMPALKRGMSGLGKFGAERAATTSGPLSPTGAAPAIGGTSVSDGRPGTAATSAPTTSSAAAGAVVASSSGGTGTAAAPASSAVAENAAREHVEPKALVGNIINEGHVNYVLMYNMLTGIRIGVSRCQAKLKRPLRDEDYQAKHKFTFDIIGNELTPSAKYDFKFKDYAPWVFRELREYFYLDPADYLLSLTAKYILSELGSPGKSGSFFYFSRDYRFIIKTIRHSEHKFLRRILKDYHEHVKANPHTLLSRFYGLHRVKLPHGRKIHFVIMNNLFPPHRDVHETYDLKGSSYGREYPEEKARTKKGATLKDINWIRRRRELELGPEKRGLFEAQLQSDVALLKRLKIMDYSLLIGLHDMRKGNSENLRQEALQVVQPSSTTAGAMTAKQAEAAPNGPLPSPAVGGPAPTGQTMTGSTSHSAFASAAAANGSAHPQVPMHLHHPYPPSPMPRRGSTTTMGTSGDEDFYDAETGLQSPAPPTATGTASNTAATKRSSTQAAPKAAKSTAATAGVQLPAYDHSERRHFLFYQDEGGFRSTDAQNQPGDWIYYLGIIDLFTPYNGIKRGENWWKSIGRDSRGISSVPPGQYGDRFVQFLSAVCRPMRWKALPRGFEKVGEMPVIEGTGKGPEEKEQEKRSDGMKPPQMQEKVAPPLPATDAAPSEKIAAASDGLAEKA
ncbi:SAICAR synthase-like protein [Jaminaea rosea]|uniref:1-phosphatidylinositol-4-phosphate 5-kinase n=1 Tax=Jaminaea rosea TaxID=1569628 RepID=A0A316URX5_9BASI|nr:SAICAR synthase-like protein [Jaminaea rosea]PWN27734.1 SAICAR synthase-like protein [Jaminaea rosea]